ncbi:uncharacterized protein si:ch211-196c10.15 [Cyprinus carpio]|uniref:Uncharacterized protein si:ch211-196c10.15 n=1 Tax=Cyprinus carpio TaxID=7962 RepID=A0A9R0BAK3_CYPCA|nr:uncharacterized protein si:ch211-196c10.15 [Cyprinus carpio]
MGHKRGHSNNSSSDAKMVSVSINACSPANSGHDYTVSCVSEEDMFSLAEEAFPALPITQSKSPVIKKRASDDTRADISTQLSGITQLINSCSDRIEKKISDMSAELKAVVEKVISLEWRMDDVERPVAQMQRRMDDMETYLRRRNLRIAGIPESAHEDIRLEVVKICQNALHSAKDKLLDVIDVVHRLRKIQQEGTKRPRVTIMQFSIRSYRDAVWKAAKNSSYLKENALRFMEDFSAGDRERRRKLWPEVQKARTEGKTAFFIGGKAFIQGQGEIILPD